MKLFTLIGAVWLFSFFVPVALRAQNDSTRLDAGVLKIRKAFTQAVRIRGADLEKMPAASLGEAINVWLYGAYSNVSTLSYVVDGNLVSDVNAYSVYDIEEVVLVQDALADLNTATGQQQLVLITTKKGGKGRSGITVGAQSGLVNTDFNHSSSVKGLSSYANWYHQYYASAYLNLRNISMGVSADYQRDVWPSQKTDSSHVGTPYSLDRFRLNGFITIKLGTKNDLDLRVNYTPEKIDSSVSYSFPNSSSIDFSGSVHMRQHLFIPTAIWHSRFSPGWENVLQASYLSSTVSANANYGNTPGPVNVQSPGQYFVTFGAGQDNRHIYIRDHLSYSVHAGVFTLDPSLNISYEHLKEGYSQTAFGNYYATYYDQRTASGEAGHFLTLTPSIEVLYRDVVDIRGGVINVTAPSSAPESGKKLYPFAGVSADVLRWGTFGDSSNLKLFGSYAKRALFSLTDYRLNDLTTGTGLYTYNLSTYPFGVYSSSGSLIPPSSTAGIEIPTNYWVWELGARLSLWKERLALSYNFERRNFTQPGFLVLPNGSAMDAFPILTSSTHFIGLSAKILQGGDWEWQSMLSLAAMKSRTGGEPYSIIVLPTGDFNRTGMSWTGGWVHRFRYRDFVAGADLLYHFGELQATGLVSTAKMNALLLQNIYVGYRVSLPRERSLELYLNSRNIWQNAHSDLSDNRRYYGAGGKMAI